MALRDQLAFLSQGTEGIEVETLMKDWHESLDDLFELIEAVIRPLISENYLSSYRTIVSVSEEVLGTYAVEALVLSSGPKKVSITPVARRVAGATGRVDLTEPTNTREVRLLRFGMRPRAKWMFEEAALRTSLATPINRLLQFSQPAVETSTNYSELTRDNVEKVLEFMFS